MSAQSCRASLLTCVGDSQPIRLRCIRAHKKSIDNYIELVRVLEKEKEDVDGAFQILRRRLDIVKSIDPPDQFPMDDACFDFA